MTRYVVRLDSRAALKEAHSGGKGAGLARLARRGFDVPPGFVVTAAAFRDHLAALGIEILGERRDWARRDLERIRELLTFCDIPGRVARPILRAYRRLGGAVAVRSSMVGEDTAHLSFAGQLDSRLDVEGEAAVLDGVRHCWASMFNWRLFQYLHEHEAASPQTVLDRFCVAVVVQRMVDARAAGVGFSADPLTGRRCVVIEAVRGLGDGLVQGRVEPDRYVVDARGVLAEELIAGPDGPALPPPAVDRLAGLVRAVARAMGGEQDVEWAWDGERFLLLQSRPITRLDGKHVYSNAMVSDMAPGLIKPMVYSTNTVSMARNVFGRLFTELIGPNDVDFAPLVRRIHSRLYTDVTLLGELFERVGLPANFFEVMTRDERAERRRPPLRPKLLLTAPRLLRFGLRMARSAPVIAAFVEHHGEALAPYRRAGWSSLPTPELLAQLDRLLALHGETQWYVFVAAINMSICNRMLGRWVTKRVPDVVPGDLIRGLVGLKALEPNAELRGLGREARALGEETCRLLMEAEDEVVRGGLSRLEGGPALVRRVDGFLQRYGFLSACGTDFTLAPWRETPTLIWRAIGRAAVDPPPARRQDAVAARRAARRRVRAGLRRHQRPLFERLLASTTTFLDLREQTSLLMSEETYHVRRLLLELGARLVERGALDRSEDIFYLSYEEAHRLVGGGWAGGPPRELVQERAEGMAADAQVELPDVMCGEDVVPQLIPPAGDQECLVGIGGSSGIARGTARVVLDPAGAPATLGRSDVLIVPFTDVGWTPLLSGVAGIVAETGGQLSHTAIVAREYGLPAVVSVKRATHLIRDGRPVTVDGSNGRVYLE